MIFFRNPCDPLTHECLKTNPIWASLRFIGFMMEMMWVILVYLLIDKFKTDWGIR